MHIFIVIIQMLVFAWNSYVITHNLSIGDGYVWVAFALFFNIGIVYSVRNTIKALIPEYTAIGYTALAEIFIICAATGMRM